MPEGRRTTLARGELAGAVRCMWRAGVVATACFSFAPTALAQGAAADDMGRRHFQAATAYMEQAEYADALREFKKAFDLSGRPELLINVAAAEERLGDLGAAVGTLARYLELDPKGEHVDTIRLRLETLRRRLETKQEAAVAPPEPAKPAPAPAAAPVKASEPPPPAGTDGAGSSSLPGWILIGVAGASVVGAGVTGAVALGEHSSAKDSCSPSCTDGQLSAGRSMAVVSTILTGVAVVAGGVGVYLLLSSSGSGAKRESVALHLGGTPGSAQATVRLGF